MVITSKNNFGSLGRYRNSQFRYSLTYVVITFLVLLFLNVYCSGTSQTLFYRSKEITMVEQCMAATADISELQVLNPVTVEAVIRQLEVPENSRLLVTDPSSLVIYDSANQISAGFYALFPEIFQALAGNKVFTCNYFDSTIVSRCAVPIYSYGALTGCLYMAEPDAEQGLLIATLERNVLFISIILELAVIFYSMIFSKRFTVRLKRIRQSMRIIRGGDYSHKVAVGGKDELTLLGDEFNALTERLNTSETKRRQFVSDASHELKTPLASIKLLSDSILQNDMDLETVREFVGDIGNEADRLTRMSTKLLSLTRIEAQVDEVSEIVNMMPTLERVVRMLSTIAERNRITICLNVVQDCPVLILEDDLYQIAFNLVENGIKYNLPGGKLTVTLTRQQDMAVLEVADTGVGIPDDAIGHLFERFFRVDKARSRKSGGSGLGLAIVRNMVERNNGSIEVTSQMGSGSVFTVRFPVFDTEEEA